MADRAESLWSATVSTSPASYRAHLAKAYWMISRELNRSTAILANLPNSQNEVKPFLTAGYWYRSQSDGPRALKMLLRARDIDAALNPTAADRILDPDAVQVYLELGRTYMLLSDPAKAVEALTRGRAIASDPHSLKRSRLSIAIPGTSRPPPSP